MNDEVTLPTGETTDEAGNAKVLRIERKAEHYKVVEETHRFPVTQVVSSPVTSNGVVVAEVLADAQTGERPQPKAGKLVRIVRPTGLNVGSSGRHMVDVTRCHAVIETVGEKNEWLTAIPLGGGANSIIEMMRASVKKQEPTEDAYKVEQEEEDDTKKLVTVGDVVILTTRNAVPISEEEAEKILAEAAAKGETDAAKA